MTNARETVPKLTVLMAVHNGGDYLPAATDSVLCQDFKNFEFLIVDDASSDETPQFLKLLVERDDRVRVLTLERNVGLTIALNRGLENARGDLIARIDADDICRPARFSLQVSAMMRDPKLVIAGGGCNVINEKGRSLGSAAEPLDDWQARWLSGFSPPAAHSTYCFRARLPGGTPVRYDPTFRTAQDFELWSRLARSGNTIVLGKPLIDYRRFSDGITAQRKREQADNGGRIAARNLADRYTPDELEALAPLTELLNFRKLAVGPAVGEAVAACRTLLRHDLPLAPSRAHRMWLQRTVSALLGDAVLARGGAIGRVPDLLRFLWYGREFLPGLAMAALNRPGTARKAIEGFLRGTAPSVQSTAPNK